MATAKGSKKAAAANQNQVQHSVPSAIRDSAPATSAPKKAASLLRRFGGAAKPTPAATKVAKRPELTLTAEAKDAVRQWVPAKILLDHFEAHAKNANSTLKGLLLDLWVDNLWESKAQPENPAVKVSKLDDAGNETRHQDLEALFVVTEKWSVQTPDTENPEESMIEALENVGLTHANAEKLVEVELDFEPAYSLDFTLLLHGNRQGKQFIKATPVQQSAGTALLEYLYGERDTLELNDAEKSTILGAEKKVFKANVTSGFLDRVTNYVTTKDQLKSVLLLIVPQEQLRGPKFGISDALDEKNTRLLQAAGEVLGVALGVEPTDE